MQDTLLEDNNNEEIMTNQFIEGFYKVRDKIYEKTLFKVVLLIEAIKNRKAAKNKVAYGMSLLNANLFKRAAVEFQAALELSRVVTLKLLDIEYRELTLQNKPDATVAVGLVLLRERDQDYVLANRLGNFARQMQDYKQANDLYRKALRIKRNYAQAFYNLAASMGRVEKYDLSVKQTIDKYIATDEFITPDYQNNPQVVEEIITKLSEKKKKVLEDQIKQLTEEKKQKNKANEVYEVQKLTNDINRLKKISIEPTKEEVCEALKAIIVTSREKQATTEDQKKYHGDIFNLGLYYFSQGDAEQAGECFQDLKDYKCTIEYLDIMITLVKDMQGFDEEAIAELFELMKKERYNRYYNVNLGLLYKKAGNRLMACKYLAVGSALLEKSEGLYRVSDIMQFAEKKVEQGAFNKAINMYRIVALETNSEDAWQRIGQILLDQEKPSEAIKAFKEIIEFKPDSEQANAKLQEIHDMYCDRAEEIFKLRRFSQAAALYERALIAIRHPKTIERTAAVYRQLKKTEKVEELMGEHDDMLEKQKEAEKEKQRLIHIKKGKVFMKRKAWDMAIASLEAAFRMKLDKNVFVSLAHIYKGMRRTKEMEDLLYRWEKMNRYEDEMKRKYKDRKREAEAIKEEEEKMV